MDYYTVAYKSSLLRVARKSYICRQFAIPPSRIVRTAVLPHNYDQTHPYLQRIVLFYVFNLDCHLECLYYMSAEVLLEPTKRHIMRHLMDAYMTFGLHISRHRFERGR